LFAEQAGDPTRMRSVVNDAFLADLAAGVAGRLGGRAGVAPRLFLRKLRLQKNSEMLTEDNGEREGK
jgi:hypothetical protein